MTGLFGELCYYFIAAFYVNKQPWNWSASILALKIFFVLVTCILTVKYSLYFAYDAKPQALNVRWWNVDLPRSTSRY